MIFLYIFLFGVLQLCGGNNTSPIFNIKKFHRVELPVASENRKVSADSERLEPSSFEISKSEEVVEVDLPASEREVREQDELPMSVSLLSAVHNDDIRLKDEPMTTSKVYLKNKLLDNLNHYFENPIEGLEILDSHPPSASIRENQVERNSVVDDRSFVRDRAIIHSTRYPTLMTTPPTPQTAKPIPLVIQETRAKRVEDINTTADQQPRAPVKKRNEGYLGDKAAEHIRDWRRRLYKAFKGNGRSTKPPTVVRVLDNSRHYQDEKKIPDMDELIDFRDASPLIVDKNRQVLLSGKEGKEPEWKPVDTPESANGEKFIRVFGTDSGARYEGQQDVAPVHIARSYIPVPPGSRRSYRTPSGQTVVFVPASNPEYRRPLPLPAQSSHFVTATASPPTLPPMISAPPPIPLLQEFAPEYTTQTPPPPPPPPAPYRAIPYQAGRIMPAPAFSAPNQQQRYPNSIPNYQFTIVTETTTQPYVRERPMVEDQDLQDNNEEMAVGRFVNRMGENSDCLPGMPCMSSQIISEEKCNSMRLRTIIQNNIVANDAEASKRAVQSAAESETGQFFDAVCGTGFFSYIAHTDEFCLASTLGVNCYVFSPVCSNNDGGGGGGDTFFGQQRRAAQKSVMLNKN